MSGALGRRAFSCGPPLLLVGVLHSTQPLVVKLSSLCWLAAVRGAGGAFGAEGSWLLQLQANLVALRVLLMLLNGLSVLGSRWGGGSACFALALRSPGCGCFCLRLDFQVTVSVKGGSRESTLGSKCLLLACGP